MSYRDLEIYKESKRLAIEIHALSLMLPKFELYEEGSQVRRSSKAVASMIVEGYGRKRYKKDYIKYLVYALSECDETIVHLDFLVDTGSLNDRTKGEALKAEYDTLSKKINKYTQWVEEEFTVKKGKAPKKEYTTTPATGKGQEDDIRSYKL
jgi:four helix bundle protein